MELGGSCVICIEPLPSGCINHKFSSFTKAIHPSDVGDLRNRVAIGDSVGTTGEVKESTIGKGVDSPSSPRQLKLNNNTNPRKKNNRGKVFIENSIPVSVFPARW